MKKIAFAVFFLVLAAICLAQRMPFGMTGRGMLVNYPNVKKELKITKDQDKQILAAIQQMQKDAMNGNTPISFNPANPMGMMDSSLDTILNDDQKARLDQIFVQANGWFSVTDSKVGTALALTDDEKKQASQIQADADTAAVEKMRSVRSNGAMKALRKAHDEAGDKIKDLLSADQQMKFTSLEGKPFKFND